MAQPGEILISYETYALIKDEICCEERDHINVKGISRPIAIYQVIDAYDNLGKGHDLIHEDHGNLKLDIDLGTMSAEERSHALIILQRTMDRLSRAGESSAPTPAKQERA